MYARAEIGETLYSLETASGHGRQRDLRRHEQIAEGLARAAPYPASELMQLTEAEVLGTVDYDSVDIWHVDTALDDGRREKYVVVMGGEVDDSLLEFLGRHLSVGDHRARVGHKPPDHRLDIKQPLDAVVDEKYLTVARQLEIDSLAYNVVAQRGHRRDDRIAVGRRGVDRREVAGSHQRELKRSRYRCRTHGEGVDVDLHLFELFLDGDAEFLFLVDDEQTEILEFHAFADQFMGADNYIDLAGLEVGEYFFDLLGRAGARQIVNPHRELLQTLAERTVMLIGKHRRRHKHGYLFAVNRGLERRTDRYLRLAETDVAAYQTVHRPGTFHVGLDSLGGRQLVGGILIDKRRLEFLLQITVGSKGIAFFLFARRIETDEIACDVLQFGFCAFLDFVPRARTDAVDFGRHTLFAPVLGQLMKSVDRHENDVVVLVDEFDHLLGATADIGAQQSSESADAMIDMDDVVSDLYLAQLLQRKGEFARTRAVALESVFMKAVEDLMIGEHADLRQVVDKAFVESGADRRKINLVSAILENGTQAVDLFFVVAQYINCISLITETTERLADKIEILVVYSLRRTVEAKRRRD